MIQAHLLALLICINALAQPGSSSPWLPCCAKAKYDFKAGWLIREARCDTLAKAQAQFAHRKWRDWEGLDVEVSVSFPFSASWLFSPDCAMLFPAWPDRAMTVLH